MTVFKVAGVDPSMTATGIAVLHSSGKEEVSIIKSRKAGDTPKDETVRLVALAGEIYEAVEGCDMVAIEGLAFMARNTTALCQLAALNYMLRAMLVEGGMAFAVVAPGSLKKFTTGRGNAKKDEMMMEVYRRWGFAAKQSDAADAYALAKLAEMMVTGKGENRAQEEVLSLINRQF